MTALHEILSAALALSPSERAELIISLWDYSSSEDWLEPSPEWRTEANRRSDVFDAGEMRCSPWAEVRARARAKTGLEGGSSS